MRIEEWTGFKPELGHELQVDRFIHPHELSLQSGKELQYYPLAFSDERDVDAAIMSLVLPEVSKKLESDRRLYFCARGPYPFSKLPKIVYQDGGDAKNVDVIPDIGVWLESSGEQVDRVATVEDKDWWRHPLLHWWTIRMVSDRFLEWIGMYILWAQLGVQLTVCRTGSATGSQTSDQLFRSLQLQGDNFREDRGA